MSMDEPRRLLALYRLGVLDTPAEDRFDHIVAIAASLFHVPLVVVALTDAERHWFKARHGWDSTYVPRNEGFFCHALNEPATFVVTDAAWDDRFFDHPLVTEDPRVRFFASHVLRAPDGSPVGTLCLMDHRPREFSEEDRCRLASLSNWVRMELAPSGLQQTRDAFQLERFFELSVDMLCISSLEGYLLRFNDALLRTLGYGPEELRALTMQELIHPEDLPAVNAEILRTAQGETRLSFEYRIRCRNGDWKWLQCNCAFNAKEGLFYAVSRDVTQQKRLEAERRRVEQLKNEFISTVSHELRTPLTSIRGALSLLEAGVVGPLPETVSDMVHIANKNSERLLRLINDILDLEKVEAGQLDFRLEPLVLSELVTQAVEAHQGYAAQYGVGVELQLKAQGARVMVDGDRFTQVLANLLSNAIKFSPAGGRVRLRLERQEELLWVSVEDQGPGIPEAFRHRIFQKFAQADGSDARKRGGTGLGLAIARSLVERMGGRLDFTTREGVGTTFLVALSEHPPQRSENAPVEAESP
ncbi:ATP-binding protein [Hyalangium gracile]|uniref:ATP-binding protein n=1 Tax=Hyalangium gracile TaxID=394092 RepID=UPI001CCFF3F7|nr:ATP-binding protein [Hyalangium gracile]